MLVFCKTLNFIPQFRGYNCPLLFSFLMKFMKNERRRFVLYGLSFKQDYLDIIINVRPLLKELKVSSDGEYSYSKKCKRICGVV